MISSPFRKALADDAVAASFSEKQLVRRDRPAEAGVFELAPEAGGPAVAAVEFLPYCDGPAGTTFFASVVGWRKLAGEDEGGAVWVGRPLADFKVWAGDIPGPDLSLAERGREPQRALSTTHNLAGAVQIVAGSLGAGPNFFGEVVNYGLYARAPAYVRMTTGGSQLIQFDFSPDPDTPHCAVPMNALWARLF
jgi:hypothetical protein